MLTSTLLLYSIRFMISFSIGLNIFDLDVFSFEWVHKVCKIMCVNNSVHVYGVRFTYSEVRIVYLEKPFNR